MAAQRKSIKVARNDLVKSLTVEVAKQTQVTPEVEEKIRAKALEKHPRQVSEAPDGAYNHSNSTLLRSIASLVALGVTLEGNLSDVWSDALDKGHVTVASETDDWTGVRKDDITIGQYIVRAAEGGQGVHVFRKGAEREGNTVADMASDLLDG